MAGISVRPELRPLVFLCAASMTSIGGHSLILIGVPWFVLQNTGSARLTGLVAFAAAAPVILATLLGGPVIDRIGRRRTSVAADLVGGLTVALIPLLHWADVLPFWSLCLLVALNGLFHAPGETARNVLLPDVADRAGLSVSRAVSFYQGLSHGTRPAGMALGGVLIALGGPEPVLLLSGAVFALAALIALGIRGIPAAEPLPDPEPLSLRGYGGELREGFVFMLTTPLLLGINAVIMFSNGVSQGWGAVLAPVHADRNLGGAAALGLLSALVGAGIVLGALVYGAWGERLPRWPVFTACFLVSGFPRFFTAAFDDGLVGLAAVVGLSSFAAGALNPILFTAFYGIVPDRLRSRVMGAGTASVLLFTPLGGLTAGYAVEWAGLPAALVAFGTAALLAGACPLVFPVWRQLDHLPDTASAVSGPPPTEPDGLPSRPDASGAV